MEIGLSIMQWSRCPSFYGKASREHGKGGRGHPFWNFPPIHVYLHQASYAPAEADPDRSGVKVGLKRNFWVWEEMIWKQERQGLNAHKLK